MHLHIKGGWGWGYWRGSWGHVRLIYERMLIYKVFDLDYNLQNEPSLKYFQQRFFNITDIGGTPRG